ncbi:hypothetical protein FN846DRAFT_903467 [Sphaerosporella brunnea]|uniref:Uncharacterized protein n=1 Tax=Sphaerosporella brunnea TaxID=1250544 RepID=A0A5J5F6T5_9PEZI|nr:hypothetical protein FN846DRAFT_903467 [Sphaerosporella brunnea]
MAAPSQAAPSAVEDEPEAFYNKMAGSWGDYCLISEEIATKSSKHFMKACGLLEMQIQNLVKKGTVLGLKLEILQLLLEKSKSGDITMAVLKEALD